MKEVILANAIYENVKEKSTSRDEFTQMFKFTARILKLETNW